MRLTIETTPEEERDLADREQLILEAATQAKLNAAAHRRAELDRKKAREKIRKTIRGIWLFTLVFGAFVFIIIMGRSDKVGNFLGELISLAKTGSVPNYPNTKEGQERWARDMGIKKEPAKANPAPEIIESENSRAIRENLEKLAVNINAIKAQDEEIRAGLNKP